MAMGRPMATDRGALATRRTLIRPTQSGGMAKAWRTRRTFIRESSHNAKPLRIAIHDPSLSWVGRASLRHDGNTTDRRPDGPGRVAARGRHGPLRRALHRPARAPRAYGSRGR